MPHTRSAEVRAANAEPDTQTKDLVIITLPDPVDPITFFFATSEVTVDGQFYEGVIRSMPAIGYSDGNNQDGGEFTIDNLENLYGPTFVNTDRRLDGGSVIIIRAWKIADGTYQTVDPVSGLTNELMRGVLRTQPISDDQIRCNIVSDTSDTSILIGGDPIFQHCDKFYNKLGTHPLGGPCGWSPTMLGFQFETAFVEEAITGSGTVAVVVTAAGMTGSPIALNPAVVALDSSSVAAGKIRAALAANANITAWFNVGGEGEKVQLSTKTKAALDATMNISITNGTCTGLTPAPVSENTTAIFCDKTLDGPQGCKAKGNFRINGIPGLVPTATAPEPGSSGGLDDPTGGYGDGAIPRRPRQLDPDIRYPFMT